MKLVFGPTSVGQIASYKQLLQMIQEITQAKRQLHGIWTSRREIILNKISSVVFSSDMNAVNLIIFLEE